MSYGIKHIHRILNSMPKLEEYHDVFDARIISLKNHYPVAEFAETVGIW